MNIVQDDQLMITYTPNVFAKRIDQALLTERPELVEQQLMVGSLAILREIGEDDIKLFTELTPQHVGKWFLNSRFDEEEQLGPDDAFRLEIFVPKSAPIDLRIITRKDEKISLRELVGTIELAKTYLLDQAKVNKPKEDMVSYVIDETDLEMMGNMNPGYEVGTTIQMPRQQAEFLNKAKDARKMIPVGNLDGCENKD